MEKSIRRTGAFLTMFTWILIFSTTQTIFHFSGMDGDEFNGVKLTIILLLMVIILLWGISFEKKQMDRFKKHNNEIEKKSYNKGLLESLEILDRDAKEAMRTDIKLRGEFGDIIGSETVYSKCREVITKQLK